MRLLRSLILALAALSVPALGQGPAVAPVPPVAAPAKQAASVSAETGHPLTKADVDNWLDGLLPWAMESGDIPGAVVVIVKDGQVLTARGFGYADKATHKPVDPETTLFRPGSTSKLFTWTAVMQQVQAGKIDLDRDVNAYLDFKIPRAFGKPVTMRNLMTHTAGFEETVKGLIGNDPSHVPPLTKVLGRWVPLRIYPPGSVPAYSNYGASLAGYIVQRVSGEDFDLYIDRHIFAPLAMARSSFRQPLPARLAPLLAKAYLPGSDAPQPFEIIPMAPAGALAATGADMARFMIAHLAHGGPLLRPETEALMQAPANTPVPGMPPMALGYYHEDLNGHTIVGHGGDTIYFHSDLHLWVNDGVGMFVSFNSPGKNTVVHPLRTRLLEQFTDRYFPAPVPQLPTVATAKAHAAAIAGHYISSRGAQSTWVKLAALLGQATVTSNDDATITVSSLVDAAGNLRRWREVGPWQWQEVGGKTRLHAVVKDGKVTAFLNGDLPAILLFMPAPALLNAAWALPALLIALGVMALTALSWPVLALVRRSYSYRHAIAGRALQLHRATRVTAWLFVLVAGAWMWILTATDTNLALFDTGFDPCLRLLQLLELVAVAGALLACWNAWILYRRADRRWWRYGWATLVALSGLFLSWLIFAMRLITWSLNY